MASGCVRDRFNNVTFLTPRFVVKLVFLLGWAANFLNTPRTCAILIIYQPHKASISEPPRNTPGRRSRAPFVTFPCHLQPPLLIWTPAEGCPTLTLIEGRHHCRCVALRLTCTAVSVCFSMSQSPAEYRLLTCTAVSVCFRMSQSPTEYRLLTCTAVSVCFRMSQSPAEYRLLTCTAVSVCFRMSQSPTEYRLLTCTAVSVCFRMSQSPAEYRLLTCTAVSVCFRMSQSPAEYRLQAEGGAP